LKKDHVWLMYAALLNYYRGKESWKAQMNEIVKGRGQSKDEISFAKYMLSQKNKNDFKSYIKSVELIETVELIEKPAYLILMHKRASDQFKDRFEPLFQYGEIMNRYRHYRQSIASFKAIFDRKLSLTDEQREMVNFHYAWALQDSGRRNEANNLWQAVLQSKNFYVKSAAAYFLGKNALADGKKADAIKFYKLVSGSAKDSKYATLSWNALKYIK